MTWPKYVLIALYVLSLVLTVLSIGKERKPYTPRDAAWLMVWTGGLAALVVLA